jgi:fucose permease
LSSLGLNGSLCSASDLKLRTVPVAYTVMSGILYEEFPVNRKLHQNYMKQGMGKSQLITNSRLYFILFACACYWGSFIACLSFATLWGFTVLTSHNKPGRCSNQVIIWLVWYGVCIWSSRVGTLHLIHMREETTRNLHVDWHLHM